MLTRLRLVSSCLSIRYCQYYSASLGRYCTFFYTTPGYPYTGKIRSAKVMEEDFYKLKTTIL